MRASHFDEFFKITIVKLWWTTIPSDYSPYAFQRTVLNYLNFVESRMPFVEEPLNGFCRIVNKLQELGIFVEVTLHFNPKGLCHVLLLLVSWAFVYY